MFKLALFDFDGVLVDSLTVYERTVTECLRAISTPIVQSREDFLALFDDNFYETLIAKGVDLSAFMQAADPILRAVDVSEIIPHQEVCAVARRIKAQRIIVSSNSAETIEIVFNHWRLERFYADIFGSEFRYSKKDKIACAMEKFCVGADETIYIGDTVGDVKEARRAGVAVAAVGWGWHSRERLAGANPDFLVDTPAELLGVFGAE